MVCIPHSAVKRIRALATQFPSVRARAALADAPGKRRGPPLVGRDPRKAAKAIYSDLGCAISRSAPAVLESRSSRSTGVVQPPWAYEPRRRAIRGLMRTRRPTQAKAASATRITLSGKWRITDMSLWDREAIDLLGPAFIEFRGNEGQFRFLAVDGWMDCRHGRRNGQPSVDFTWDGNDEGDPVSGRGWVLLRQDGSLTGHIYFHRGDDSGLTAMPFEDDARPTARSSLKRKQRLR